VKDETMYIRAFTYVTCSNIAFLCSIHMLCVYKLVYKYPSRVFISVYCMEI